MSGIFVVIAGPSAVGKNAVVGELLRRVPNSARLITTTTRLPREGEIDGRDYFFVTRKKFEEMQAGGAFLEHNEVHGHCYGSSRDALDALLKTHQIVFGIIDPEGFLKAKDRFPKDTVAIFLKPASLDELVARIQKERISGDEIEKRVRNAYKELELASQFDHVVINAEGGLENALYDISTILHRCLNKPHQGTS